jgi:hypothetical protein
VRSRDLDIKGAVKVAQHWKENKVTGRCSIKKECMVWQTGLSPGCSNKEANVWRLLAIRRDHINVSLYH